MSLKFLNAIGSHFKFPHNMQHDGSLIPFYPPQSHTAGLTVLLHSLKLKVHAVLLLNGRQCAYL
jgi:hypothetical protein